MNIELSQITVLVLAAISGGATAIGVFIGTRIKKNPWIVSFGASFAAIIMVLISLLELIPESFHEIGWQALLWTAVGAGIIWIINIFLPHIHSIRGLEDCNKKCALQLSYLLMVGLLLHDFPEGFAIASAQEHSVRLGWLVVLGVLIHNIPEGYVLTVSADSRQSQGFCYRSAGLSALSTFLGALLGVLLLSLGIFINPILLGLAAGAMLFIALHELIPFSLRNHRWSGLIAGCASAVVLYILLSLIP